MEDGIKDSPKIEPGNFNINPDITVSNQTDDNDNPTGGSVALMVVKGENEDFPALVVNWQDGPRGQEGTDELSAPNGAFVEDVIYAAIQRLEFFEQSKYKSEYNEKAIQYLTAALSCLDVRSKKRAEAGTLGKHEV